MFSKEKLSKDRKKPSIFGGDSTTSDNNKKAVGIKKYSKKKKKNRVHIYNTLVNKDVLDNSKESGGIELKEEPNLNISDLIGIDENDKLELDLDSGLVDLGSMITPEKAIKHTDHIELSPDRDLTEIEANSKFSDDIKYKAAMGDILAALHEYLRDKIESTREKFKEYHIPDPIASKKALLERIEKHLHIIPELLAGKIEMSYFYDLAKEQQRKSIGETINFKEKLLIDWSKFFGGYYGFKRQLFVASVIISKCRKELNSALKKNSTLAYWTPPGFSTYVLANEIIIRLIMEDFKCNFDKAENIIRETSDYGVVILDTVELNDDLEVGELLQEESRIFMKDIQDELLSQEKINLMKQKNSNSTILEDLLNNSFTSEDES